MRTPGRLAAAFACATLWSPAAAAPQVLAFSIPAGPRDETLIRIAQAAHVTLVEAAPCGGRSPAISGGMPLQTALTRALAGSKCAFEFIDPQTIRTVLARAARAPARSERAAPPTEVSEVLVTRTDDRPGADVLAGSTSMVFGAQIAQLGAEGPGAADALATALAGLTITNLGPGRDKLLIRGVADSVFTGRARSVVGVLLDDMPLTVNAPDPDLRLVDMERVEISRGPQADFFGAGAIGGVYRMVPNKPELGEAAEEASLSWAGTANGGPSGAADVMLNLPLRPDVAALRLVGYEELQGGYLHNSARRRRGINPTERQGGRAALRIRLSDDWSVGLSLVGQKLADADSQYVTPGGDRYRRPRWIREAQRNALREGALTVNGQGDWGHLSLLVGGVGRHTLSVNNAETLQSSSAPASNAAYVEETRARLQVGELNFSSPTDRRLRWLAGVYVAQSTKALPSSLVRGGDAGPVTTAYTEMRRESATDTAAYATASKDLSEVWTITAGARLAQTRSRESVAAIIGSRPLRRDANRTEGDVSPFLSLQRALGGGSVYALYSEGFRPGGMNSVGLGRTKFTPETFSADHLRNLEFGAHTAFSRNGEIRAAVFLENWTRVQSDQFTSFGGAYTVNVGDARNVGLEIETSYAPTPRLTLTGQAQWLRTRLVNPDPVYVGHARGGLAGVPPVSAGAVIAYHHPLPGGAELTLSGEGAYRGRSYVSLEAPSGRFRVRAMGDYVSDRLSVGVAEPAWSVALFAENLTNASRDTFAFGNPFSFGRIYQSTPQRPRTIGVRLSACR